MREPTQLWTRGSHWPDHWPLLEAKHIHVPTGRLKPIDPHSVTLARWIVLATFDSRIQGVIYSALVDNLVEHVPHVTKNDREVLIQALPNFRALSHLHREGYREHYARAWNATGFELGYAVPRRMRVPLP